MGINLTQKPDEWDREREHLLLHVAELTRQVEWWQAQWRLLAHHRFGASQERSDQIQLNLFNEAEVLADNEPNPVDAAEDRGIRDSSKSEGDEGRHARISRSAHRTPANSGPEGPRCRRQSRAINRRCFGMEALGNVVFKRQ